VVVLTPDVGRITMFDFEHAMEAVDAGEAEARARIDEIRALLD